MKKRLYVIDRREWRSWLEKNHADVEEIWLSYFKKHTGKPGIPYNDAVEEALCFGWIDSIIKKIDEEIYLRKFTPRKANSKWSELNKKRAAKMIEQGRMTEFGLCKIETAKKTGLWDKPDRPRLSFEMSDEFEQALTNNPKARAFFKQLAPTYKTHFIGWISTAKRQETKNRRVKETITLLEQGKKLGLK
jgi:uncharacterized protein YdeI (YjbR/CyaY-like superfamily)